MKSLREFIVEQARKNSAQKKAFEAYRNAERQQDRYMGSVFVTPHGQREHEAKVTAAYKACKDLGMGIEHGL